MGVMLDRVQFVLVRITFNELMWSNDRLNDDTTQEFK